MLRSHVNNSIRSLRLQKLPSWRQQDLAERVGVSRGQIGDYERGEVVPTLPIAMRIAAALGQPVETVFWGCLEEALARLAVTLEPPRAAHEPGAAAMVRPEGLVPPLRPPTEGAREHR